MSEYQYYEWQTVDRLLTPEEQSAVNGLSSHIEVSASRAVVTYNWSSFRHDPKEVLLQYFDAFFYLANWGTLQLMFRFSAGLLDAAEVQRYCDGEVLTFETIGRHQVLSIELNPEDSELYELDASLSDFIRLRNDLLEGDYRLLYLAWLLHSTNEPDEYDYEDDDEYEEEGEDEFDHANSGPGGSDPDTSGVREPPVPPGLQKLTPALENFIRVFGIDPFVVKAAAEASPDLRASQAVNYRELVARLPRAECDGFLARLADGDPGLRLDLRRRLKEFQPKESAAASDAEPRALQDLLQRAGALEEAENTRKAEAARQKHITEMKNLAQREPQAWHQVETLLETGPKSGSTYDEATKMLEELEQLADFQDTRAAFFSNVQVLAARFTPSRPSLLKRWQGKGWV
ncbi:MAG: hypothetical protein EHM21_07085 [Chloroflexi bacterium]|nr:MAG: hypothetical protein EHM21_07085 [Chloroflexota bacterium]